MKKTLLLLITLLTFSVNITAQATLHAGENTNTRPLRLSILGDSYSTFTGFVQPEWNFCWYGEGNLDRRPTVKNDVTDVEQTWWQLLAKEMDYKIEKNNSFSGSTVCYTGYGRRDFSDRAFITRMCNLGNPDVIIVLSGTNDSWAKAPVGDYKWKNWTRKDLYAFRPAFCYMMTYLRTNYPNTRIINVCNDGLSPEVTETQEVVCQRFKIEHVLLHDIEKQDGHPSIKGMQAICNQIKEKIKTE